MHFPLSAFFHDPEISKKRLLYRIIRVCFRFLALKAADRHFLESSILGSLQLWLFVRRMCKGASESVFKKHV